MKAREFWVSDDDCYNEVQAKFYNIVKEKFIHVVEVTTPDEVTELKAQLANLHLNYDLRVKEIQELNDNSSEDKWNYWRKMYTITRDELMFVRHELLDARNMFILMLVPPIDEPKTVLDYKSLWERDKRDAKNGIRAIDEAFERLK